MSSKSVSAAGDLQSFHPSPSYHIHQPLSLKKKEKKGNKKSAFQIHKKAVLFQQQRKHVNVNKTFILFVNRLLNKVNITVMEGEKTSIKMPTEAIVFTVPKYGDERRECCWCLPVLLT